MSGVVAHNCCIRCRGTARSDFHAKCGHPPSSPSRGVYRASLRYHPQHIQRRGCWDGGRAPSFCIRCLSSITGKNGSGEGPLHFASGAAVSCGLTFMQNAVSRLSITHHFETIHNTIQGWGAGEEGGPLHFVTGVRLWRSCELVFIDRNVSLFSRSTNAIR